MKLRYGAAVLLISDERQRRGRIKIEEGTLDPINSKMVDIQGPAATQRDGALLSKKVSG